MNNLSTSANYKGNPPRLTPSYRGTIKSWHGRILPWRGLGRGPVKVPTHLRIDTSIRPSPGAGAFHGNGHSHLECGGRSI
ncbi:hypothetical protein CDL15_Pgr002549 [Punica granatum]|nr:hypothetical protein CDL15_Pgr002549 [Punica granatum]